MQDWVKQPHPPSQEISHTTTEGAWLATSWCKVTALPPCAGCTPRIGMNSSAAQEIRYIWFCPKDLVYNTLVRQETHLTPGWIATAQALGHERSGNQLRPTSLTQTTHWRPAGYGDRENLPWKCNPKKILRATGSQPWVRWPPLEWKSMTRYAATKSTDATMNTWCHGTRCWTPSKRPTPSWTPRTAS